MAFLACANHGVLPRHDLDEEAIIGRHPDCQVVLSVGAVSRQHARVIRQVDDYMLEDLGSRNGTFVNGKLITERHRLSEGDCIRICEVELTFHDEQRSSFSPVSEMTFDGTPFGIMMVDDAEGDPATVTSASRVSIQRSGDSVRLAASPEAKLSALLKITQNLGQSLALDEVLPKVLMSLFEIFPQADRGFVVLQQEDGALIPQWVKTRNRQQDEAIRISRTIIQKVMSSGEPILSLDAANDERFDSAASIADFRIRSMICAPLIDGEGVAFGALQIDSLDGHSRFADNDVDLLAAVASQAGIVIRNAQLHEQALQQREVEQDLKLSIEVQQAFLPQAPPNIPGYEVRSYYRAANHIGGDYFDYIPLLQGRWAVVVADVVGHGVAAAMFMAKLSAETRFCLAGEEDLAKAVENLNDRMSSLQVERFVTFLALVIQPDGNQVQLVNAGHMRPVIRSAGDGSVTEPGDEQSGLPIAIMEGMAYQAFTLTMQPGDLLLLYTDGINEAMNAADEQFGIEAIHRIVREGQGADATLQRLVNAVAGHLRNHPPDDDMCVVVIERTSGNDSRSNSDTNPD